MGMCKEAHLVQSWFASCYRCPSAGHQTSSIALVKFNVLGYKMNRPWPDPALGYKSCADTRTETLIRHETQAPAVRYEQMSQSLPALTRLTFNSNIVQSADGSL